LRDIREWRDASDYRDDVNNLKKNNGRHNPGIKRNNSSAEKIVVINRKFLVCIA